MFKWLLVRIAATLMLMAPAMPTLADADCTQNQATLNECAEKSAQDSEVDLNAAFQSALAATRSHRSAISKQDLVDALTASQTAWLTSRDATCLFDAMILGGGGSMGNTVYSGCLESLNSRRALGLRKLAECFEAYDCKFPVALFQYQIRLKANELSWE